VGKSINRRVEFKQFTVRDEKCAMKIGTDALLLAAWCDTASASRIVDFGCGSGIIALMVAQRAPESQVIGVELEEGAVAQAIDNFNDSPFTNRLTAAYESVQEFSTKPEHQGTFDLVVSNPPYFHDKPKSPNMARNLARHDESLPIDALMACAAAVMKPDGVFSCVWPMERKEDLFVTAKNANMRLLRFCEIAGSPEHEAVRFLSEWTHQDSKTKENSLGEQERINIEEGPRNEGRPRLSNRYKMLLKDFVPDLG
jgi:tRNA1Val (adenine37-N6)-methyltransferase